MERILKQKISEKEAVIWFLGQSGFIIKSCGKTVVIDPYLSNYDGEKNPQFNRAVPIPMEPSELKVDIYIVTHNHEDHLDPATISKYKFKDETIFVAPRLASKTLVSLGIPQKNITKIDSVESEVINGVKITGIYAVPNGVSSADTCGYKIEFENGRSVYHTGDTDYCDFLGSDAKGVDVLLTCINGIWNNLDVEQAVKLAVRVNPKIAIPHHYDMFKLNSQNPETFKFFMRPTKIRTEILKVMEPLVW
jgi:L-ascorbate 6-phosphate lactonase